MTQDNQQRRQRILSGAISNHAIRGADLRETKRRLAAKLDRLTWLTIGGLGVVVIALIGMIAALVALIVQL